MKAISVPSSSPSTPPKPIPPKLGIASLIIAILAIVLGCVVFQVPVMYPPPTNANQFVDYTKTLGAFVVGVIVFSVIGLILGIAGTSKESKKPFAILGLILNLLNAIGWGFFMAYGLGSMFGG